MRRTRMAHLPPPLGAVYYAIDQTSHGRVTAFHYRDQRLAALSARERLAQVGGINLPIDATETNLNSTYCLVWKSRTLKKLVGMGYAAATTGIDNTTAQMRAEATPHC